MNQGHQDDQHGDDINQQFDALKGAPGDGVHGSGNLGRCGQLSAGGGFCFGDHDLGNGHGSRNADDGSGENVAHDAGNDIAQDTGIQDHYRSGDGCHARRHQGEQFAAGHRLQVGPDEKGRLHHAHEYIGRHRQTFGPRPRPWFFSGTRKSPATTSGRMRQ